jgi:phosphotransferase system  glucose/maltose/N-acetylglucosamine-specific IIC component
MKKITKIKIGAVIFSVLHFVLSFLGAGLFARMLVSEVGEGFLINLLGVFTVILYLPFLGLFNIMFFNLEAPNWIQFIVLGANSLLWGFVFYKIIKYFAFKKEKNGNNNKEGTE